MIRADIYRFCDNSPYLIRRDDDNIKDYNIRWIGYNLALAESDTRSKMLTGVETKLYNGEHRRPIYTHLHPASEILFILAQYSILAVEQRG